MSEMIKQKTAIRQSIPTEQTKSISPTAAALRQLLKSAPQLSSKQKMVVLRHLQRAGFVAERQSCCSKRLNSTIELRSDQSINEDGAMELTALLIEFTGAIEPMLARTWEELSPQSRFSLPRHFSKRVRQFLTNHEVPNRAIVEELRYLRWFISAMVAAIARAGDEFAVRFSDSVSPAAISAMVDSEREGLVAKLFNRFKGKDACCGQKYCELMNETTQETISRGVRQAVGDYMESFIRDTASAAARVRENKPC